MADERTYTQAEVERLVRDAVLIKGIELQSAKDVLERVLRCWVTDTDGLADRHERVFNEACGYTRDVVCRVVIRHSSDELRRWRRRLQRATVKIPDTDYLLAEINVELQKRREQGLH